MKKLNLSRSRTGHHGIGRLGRFVTAFVPSSAEINGRDALPRVRFGGAQRRPTGKNSTPALVNQGRGFW